MSPPSHTKLRVCSLLTEAQICVKEKTLLRPCDGLDLSTLRCPRDYLQAANNVETLQIIEECMSVWIKQIEKVNVAQ